MNAKAFLKILRGRLRDTVEPYGWSDAELINDYANDARNQMFRTCRKLILDSSTAEDATGLPLCRLTLEAGISDYALSPKILRIARVSVDGKPLTEIKASSLEDTVPGWRTIDAGIPQFYCQDMGTDSLTLIPVPKTAITAVISVFRYPLEPLTVSSTSMGLPEEYEYDLIPGVLARAYSANDGETVDPNREIKQQGIFDSRLQEIKDALVRKYASRHTNNAPRAFRTK